MGLEIDGSREFRRQVRAALLLLETEAPHAHKMVLDNVGRIRHADVSGMDVLSEPATCNLSSITAFFSVTWCASVIAHEAMHAKMYRDHPLFARGFRVPLNAYSGVEAEKICIAHQVAVLEAIGAPQREIAHTRDQDGTHALRGKYGVWW